MAKSKKSTSEITILAVEEGEPSKFHPKTITMPYPTYPNSELTYDIGLGEMGIYFDHGEGNERNAIGLIKIGNKKIFENPTVLDEYNKLNSSERLVEKKEAEDTYFRKEISGFQEEFSIWLEKYANHKIPQIRKAVEFGEEARKYLEEGDLQKSYSKYTNAVGILQQIRIDEEMMGKMIKEFESRIERHKDIINCEKMKIYHLTAVELYENGEFEKTRDIINRGAEKLYEYQEKAKNVKKLPGMLEDELKMIEKFSEKRPDASTEDQKFREKIVEDKQRNVKIIERAIKDAEIERQVWTNGYADASAFFNTIE